MGVAVRKVFIANRGEVAVRIARACRELGLRSVAAASEADASAYHARVADEVIVVGPPPAAESYLHVERLLCAARDAGCDAVHPGYGFLSQNADFAEAVADAGLVFVGPDPAALRTMGDKIAARRAMERAGVPVVPGFQEEGADDARLEGEARRLGFPLLVKAAAGGGGRGMRVVEDEAGLAEALAAARREAEKAFGDGRLYLERLVRGARHVEIQVLADGETTLSLLERDCSVQRRYQKVVEESPSPAVDPDLRRRMGECAVRAAEACGYVGAGTVEFLLAEDGEFFFLEMNTRLQVEHPVTEWVTGIDIVQWQLRIAGGERLPWRQEDVVARGHAIECRLNAEDPRRGFLPSTGRVLLAAYPVGPGIRVDAGYEGGDEISRHYDSLIAKIVVHAEDRPRALARMRVALRRTAVLGMKTNLDFLRWVVDHPEFGAGTATTSFVRDAFDPSEIGREEPSETAFVAAAVAESLSARAAGASEGDGGEQAFDPWSVADGFRLGGG